MSKGDLVRVTVLTPPTTTAFILEARGDGQKVEPQRQGKLVVVEVQNRNGEPLRKSEFSADAVIAVETMTRRQLDAEKTAPVKRKVASRAKQPEAVED